MANSGFEALKNKLKQVATSDTSSSAPTNPQDTAARKKASFSSRFTKRVPKGATKKGCC